MGPRGLRRATLILLVSSVALALFITNTALECESGTEMAFLKVRELPLSRQIMTASLDRLAHTTAAFDTADIVRRFRKAMSTQSGQSSVESSCSQAGTNSSHSVSLLVTGSLELGTDRWQPDQVAKVLGDLPTADMMVSILSNPLSWDSSPTLSQTLRVLNEGGLGVVSLATERILFAGEDGVRLTTHYLEEARVHWLGLSIKSDDIMVFNGLRIGFLGYCAVYRECEVIENSPFSPVKYSTKAASAAVKSLRSRGAELIVVLLRWGRGGSYFPDETALVTARYLASLGVTLVIGDHPVLQQSHAYFEETLVVFSPGSFSRSPISYSSQLCWTQGEDGVFQYSESDHCQAVHPRVRSSLLASEQHTSFYQIYLSRSVPAVADYVTVPLSGGVSGSHHFPLTGHSLSWTRVCGSQDLKCLTCTSM